jgi:putative flippase GtrA
MPSLAVRALWRQHSGKMVRFGLVGLSNTLISYLTFRAILAVADIAFVAQVFGYAAGVVWSFALNSRWTFGQTGFSHRQFLRFLVLQGGLLLASSAAIGLAVDHAGFQPDLSWLAVMAVVTLVNYLLSHGWVFADGERGGRAGARRS